MVCQIRESKISYMCRWFFK